LVGVKVGSDNLDCLISETSVCHYPAWMIV
jgi:hypothetical protein